MGRTVPAGCDRNGDPPGEKKEAPSSLCHFWLRAPRGFPLGLTFAPVRPPLARPTSVVPLSARRRIRHLAPVLPFGFARLDRSCRSEADGQHTGAPEGGQRQFLALPLLPPQVRHRSASRPSTTATSPARCWRRPETIAPSTAFPTSGTRTATSPSATRRVPLSPTGSKR